MQKVESSSLFIRFQERPAKRRGFFFVHVVSECELP
jgi:hypothetical protein